LCVSCAMVKKVASKVKNTYYKTKWAFQRTFAGMNPVKRMASQKRLQQNMVRKKIQSDAVANIKMLQSRAMLNQTRDMLQRNVALKPQAKPVTLPAPLKAPSRPPPPPPNKTPMRPTIPMQKVPPKVPVKPLALRVRK